MGAGTYVFSSEEACGLRDTRFVGARASQRFEEKRNMNRNRRLVGAAVATAAAMLFVTGGGAATAADNGGTVKVKCYGANACKGQAECKTSMNECKGHNACKGKGFVTTDSEKACIDKLGRA
jgi:hypothetical protein